MVRLQELKVTHIHEIAETQASILTDDSEMESLQFLWTAKDILSITRCE